MDSSEQSNIVNISTNADGTLNFSIDLLASASVDITDDAEFAVTINSNEDGSIAVKIGVVTAPEEDVPQTPEVPEEEPTVIKRIKTNRKPKVETSDEMYGSSSDELIVPSKVLKAMNFGLQCVVSVRPEHPATYLGLVMRRYQQREAEVEEMEAAFENHTENGTVSKKGLFEICKQLQIETWLVMKTMQIDASAAMQADDLFMCLFSLTDEEQLIPLQATKNKVGLNRNKTRRKQLALGSLEEVWDKYDENMNGFLEIEEVSLMVVELQMNWHTWELYKALDKNNDSRVAKQEFFEFFSSRLSA